MIRGIHYALLCGTIIGIVPHGCVMNASVSFMLSSFSKWGQLCFVNTMGRRQMKKFPLLQACLRGKSSTFFKWHCLRKIALESKRLIHTWWTWCLITWKRIFYPIQQKSMVFNQNRCILFGPPCIAECGLSGVQWASAHFENLNGCLGPALDPKPCSLDHWTHFIHTQQNSARGKDWGNQHWNASLCAADSLMTSVSL